MDPLNPWIKTLTDISESDVPIVGGKAAKLARLARLGYHVPSGFCLTIHAYQDFSRANRLDRIIAFELGRKRFQDMRWEELWDAALRIRSSFLRASIPHFIVEAIVASLQALGPGIPLAVRSSAPKEDAAGASFAGLHESYIGVSGTEGLLDSVRLVWASLWSDAALLYQQELGLDPVHSSMAVLVQEVVREDISGVAFGCDPRAPEKDKAIIEAVPGLCQNLVDGTIEPDRWLLNSSTGELVEFSPGHRNGQEKQSPLLSQRDLENLYGVLRGIESAFGWKPDAEWTGQQERFTLLQARPITTSTSAAQDEKTYYLTLRPGERRLQELAARVAEDLIPRLEKEGEALAAEDLMALNDEALADRIEARQESLKQWEQVYRDEFIPFAHGVRRLATYYNDAVRPPDPYEFVGLLKGQALRSIRRNRKITELACQVQQDPPLLKHLEHYISLPPETRPSWQKLCQQLNKQASAKAFIVALETLLHEFMDVSYGTTRLKDQPELMVRTILELAASGHTAHEQARQIDERSIVSTLEKKLFDAVGSKRRAEAQEVLRIGRLSWTLRDDDNLLLGRIESQFLRALQVGLERLRSQRRVKGQGQPGRAAAQSVVAALRDPSGDPVSLPRERRAGRRTAAETKGVRPRQAVGQPAAPGLATGFVRRIRGTDDFAAFRTGDILVCDAIQPNMTHLVPLARGIIERRGGMLIHGAIIARELGIPCVNGVPDAVNLFDDGELVTVDGYLGIVTVGKPEFNLERSTA